jgi:hypothetical protein
MNHEWTIEVVDEKGNAVSGARVALVPSSALAGKNWPFTTVAATHKHAGAGKYEASSPMKPVTADFTLLVTLPGKSPVVQPLKMKQTKNAGEFATTPAPRSAATVSASSEIKTSGKIKIRRTRFKVTLHKTSEVVAVSGTEYHDKGTRFRLFAESRRDDLRSRKQVNAGVIWTLFSTDDRSIETFVPAVGSAWLRVAIQKLGPTDAINPGSQHNAESGSDVSPPHVYRYLSSVGKLDPGRVQEVSVFSHSYPVGPILFNTEDDPNSERRSPADFDMRVKDFAPVNTAAWPSMAAAMASTGEWHIWGCSATTHHKNLASEAQDQRKKSTPDNVSFVVRSTVNTDDGRPLLRIEERTTLARLRVLFDQSFRNATYMAAAAAHLNRPVFGAPPGVGSSFLLVGKRPFMLIQPENYSRLYAYFKAEFAPHFAPTKAATDAGYVDYAALRARPIPPAPAFASDCYALTINLVAERSTVKFANGKSVSIDATDLQLKTSALSGFAKPGKSGHLYELRVVSDEAKSVARYVQEDGKVFVVSKDAAGKFTLLGGEV